MSEKRAYIIPSVITSKIYAPHVVPLSCRSIQGRDYHHKEEKCWPVINKASIPVFCFHVVGGVGVGIKDWRGGEMVWVGLGNGLELDLQQERNVRDLFDLRFSGEKLVVVIVVVLNFCFYSVFFFLISRRK